MKKLLIILSLIFTACAAPTAFPSQTVSPPQSTAAQTISTATFAPPSPTVLPATPTVAPTLTGILNQPCSLGNVTDFNTCTNSYCCQTNAACNNDPDCVAAARCFQQNGGMRGYGGISNCYQLPGAEKYMQNFACRFQHCGQFMTINAGELCLTEKCANVTAACFSNPDCFALKFCIVDKAGTPVECRQRHPEGIPDFDRWTACGNETGCYALMP